MNNDINNNNYKIILEKPEEKKPIFKRKPESILALILACTITIGGGIAVRGYNTDKKEENCSTYFAHDVIKDYINNPGEFETTIEALESSVYLTDNGKALYDDIYIHNYLEHNYYIYQLFEEYYNCSIYYL